MRILLLHPNFPGQYRHIARHLAADPKNEVVFLCNPKPVEIPKVRKVEVHYVRVGTSGAHEHLQDFEEAAYRGQAIARTCLNLKAQGFVPDVICAHPGWGDALFLKDVFPGVPLLNYCEFYYRAFGADAHFDPRQSVDMNNLWRIRLKNANNILNLEACDWGITPTFWQHRQHPSEFLNKISVLHEGIDTDALQPSAPKEPLALASGVRLAPGDEIVTYVARNLEPYRGFPNFMKAVEILNRTRPNCHIFIIGNDGASYSKPPKDTTFKKLVMSRTKTDPKRVHFLGYLPYNQMVSLLRYSRVHVYLTVPFVLSWSMLEAMALGGLVLGSDTPPVREIIEDGKNGLLVDFFSPEKIAGRVAEALDHPKDMEPLRAAARRTIEDRYALKNLLPLHIALVQDLAARKVPPPTHEKILALTPPSPASLNPLKNQTR
ncbi:MAG: glycosyltransferase [Elusimicrobia bacterium]|nr:glycosyltransferase [Elusimicrobiota bacterium]